MPSTAGPRKLPRLQRKGLSVLTPETWTTDSAPECWGEGAPRASMVLTGGLPRSGADQGSDAFEIRFLIFPGDRQSEPEVNLNKCDKLASWNNLVVLTSFPLCCLECYPGC